MDELRGELVLKTRLRHLLSDRGKLHRLRDAVARVDRIVHDAYIFLKLLYCDAFEIALRSREWDATLWVSLPPVTSPDFINDCLKTCSTSVTATGKKQGGAYGPTKSDQMARLRAFHERLQAEGLMPERHSSLHLAHVLYYSKIEMATALSNNVVMRYASYVYRFVNTRLLPMELRRLGVQSLTALPTSVRADVLSGINAVKKDVETRRDPKLSPVRFHAWIDQHVDDLVRPKPSGAGNDWNAFDYLEDDIPRCLSYMVHINRLLEDDGQRLFSPLCLRMSWTPGHIRLDTAAMAEILLEDADEVSRIRTDLSLTSVPETALTWDLPELKRKESLQWSLKKLCTPELYKRLQGDEQRNSALLKTEYWRSICRLDTNRHNRSLYRGRVFNNMIDTDGYAVSLHFVPPHLHGATAYNGGKVASKRTSKNAKARKHVKREWPYVHELSKDERAELLRDERLLAGVDPGKRDLVTVCDAVRGPKVRYSAVQRRWELFSKRHREQRLRLLRSAVPEDCRFHDLRRMFDPGGTRVTTYEGLQALLTETTSRSSRYDVFARYVARRQAILQHMKRLFSANSFRAAKYRTHVAERSSEAKLVSRIEKAFPQGDPVLMYGNWGRDPNLRNSAPTPGVGLRRRLSRRFRTVTVDEHLTSSVCASCHTKKVAHPIGRSYTQGGRRHDRPLHSLLRCQNEMCSSKWWARDVMGAVNILCNGRHVLRHGAGHRAFRRQSRGGNEGF